MDKLWGLDRLWGQMYRKGHESGADSLTVLSEWLIHDPPSSMPEIFIVRAVVNYTLLKPLERNTVTDKGTEVLKALMPSGILGEMYFCVIPAICIVSNSLPKDL